MYRPLNVALTFTQAPDFDREPAQFAELAPRVVAVSFKEGFAIAFFDERYWQPKKPVNSTFETYEDLSGDRRTLLQDQEYAILLGAGLLIEDGDMREILTLKDMLKTAPAYIQPTRGDGFFDKPELFKIPEKT